MFDEEFSKLSRGEQSQFQDVVSTLLYKCYLVRRTFDKTSTIGKINPSYLFVERHYDLISQYLEFAGISVNVDSDNGVIYTSSDLDTNRIKLDGVTTLIIYALRSYYEDKLGTNPTSNEVKIDASSLRGLLRDLALSTVSKRISSVTIQSSLRILSSYNIICLSKGSFNDSSYEFYILPSIRYVISNARLNALYSMITNIDSNDIDQ